MLVALFVLQMIVFTFFTGSRSNQNYWWASMTIVPVFVIAGWWLSRWPRALSLTLVMFLALYSVTTVRRVGRAAPRWSASERVAAALSAAESAQTANRLNQLEWDLMWAMHIAPPHADLMAYLSRIAENRGERSRAAYFVRRSLALDARQPLALAVAREIDGSTSPR